MKKTLPFLIAVLLLVLTTTTVFDGGLEIEWAESSRS